MPDRVRPRGGAPLPDARDVPTGRRRRLRRGRGAPRAQRVLLAVVAALVLLPLAVVGAFAGHVHRVVAQAPSIDALTERAAPRVSAVYDARGGLLGYVRADAVSVPLSSRQIPEVVKRATLAIEDRRFYEHRGLDFVGIVRAAARNLQEGDVVQGGSTLTMQLVRALYISRERTFRRKLVEAKLASEIERRRSKRWILTTYLNTVPYGTRAGHELVGVHAAARGYFGKPAWRLRLHEAALLAGLPQAPSRLSPVRHPRRAKQRRDAVLRAMVETGDITAARARRAMRKGLGVRERPFYRRRAEPFVLDEVRRRLVARYGRERVETGGLRVHTTIDPKLQRRARKAIRAHLDRPGDPLAAVVSISPRTGRVRAMASAARYADSKFRLSTQAHRQPGSAFKPFALVAAVERGIDPWRKRYASSPVNLPATPWGPVEVKNYDDSYAGRIDLARATLRSDNAVYTRLTLDIGPRAVRHAARTLGIRSPLGAHPALTLGGLRKGVTPLEMARAYATLAADGTRRRAMLIRRVELPDGRVAHPERPHPHQAVDVETARAVTEILRRNVQRGTGTAARIHCPAAGKTGTTDDHKDAWFVGYTPRLATAVWVGHRRPRPMLAVHGIRVAGGTFPARIWGTYMREAVHRCGRFQAPRRSAPSCAACQEGDTGPQRRAATVVGTSGAAPNVRP